MTYMDSIYGVLTAPMPPIFVCDGDSLTEGVGCSNPATKSYPALVHLDAENGAPGTCDLVVAAVSGQQVSDMISRAATYVDPHRNTRRARNVLLALDGPDNSIWFGATARQAVDAYWTYIDARVAAGWAKADIGVGTILPRSTPGAPADFNATRSSANTLIRNEYASHAGFLVDIAADSRVGDDGDEADATYYSGDLGHLNDAGYQIKADLAIAEIA